MQPFFQYDDVTKFIDITYNGAVCYNSCNCVEFILAFFQYLELLPEVPEDEDVKAIFIDYEDITNAADSYMKAVLAKDYRVLGAPNWLIKKGFAKRIELERAKFGDIIHYNYLSNGVQKGHTAIFHSIQKKNNSEHIDERGGRYDIIGSHKSIGGFGLISIDEKTITSQNSYCIARISNHINT